MVNKRRLEWAALPCKSLPVRQISKTVILLAFFAARVLLAAGPEKSVSRSVARSGSSPEAQTEMAKLIRVFAGSWSIRLISPNGQTEKQAGSGEEIWRAGPGANSLIEEYHSTGDEGEISGLGVFWWDKSAGRFQVVWCDNTDPGGCATITRGARWEGGNLVLLNEWEASGKKSTLKEVFSGFTENSFAQTLYQGDSGGDLKKIVTIKATRKDGSVSPN